MHYKDNEPSLHDLFSLLHLFNEILEYVSRILVLWVFAGILVVFEGKLGNKVHVICDYPKDQADKDANVEKDAISKLLVHMVVRYLERSGSNESREDNHQTKDGQALDHVFDKQIKLERWEVFGFLVHAFIQQLVLLYLDLSLSELSF